MFTPKESIGEKPGSGARSGMDDENDLLDAIRGDTPESPLPPGDERRFSGWWILLILLAPLCISLLALTYDSGNYGEIGLLALLVACPTAGIIVGFLFAARLRNPSVAQRIVAGFGMSIVFTVASAALACGGCAVIFKVFSMSR
jgi:hypothetical protein